MRLDKGWREREARKKWRRDKEGGNIRKEERRSGVMGTGKKWTAQYTDHNEVRG